MNRIRSWIAVFVLATSGCQKSVDPAIVFSQNNVELNAFVDACRNNANISIVRSSDKPEKDGPLVVRKIHDYLADNNFKSFQCDRDRINEGKLISARLVTDSMGLSVSGKIEGLVFYTDYGLSLNASNLDGDLKSSALRKLPEPGWFAFVY